MEQSKNKLREKLYKFCDVCQHMCHDAVSKAVDKKYLDDDWDYWDEVEYRERKYCTKCLHAYALDMRARYIAYRILNRIRELNKKQIN